MSHMFDLKILKIRFVTLITLISLSNGYIGCPEQIAQNCVCHSASLSIRCTNKNLKEFPDLTSIQKNIRNLDVSFNVLDTIPTNLDQYTLLETLDLSYNQIATISTEIKFPISLRYLHLSYNNITNWLQINPNTILHSAINLHTLSLAGNPLKSFTGNDEHFLLTSNSLKLLDLSECQITKILGPLTLSGLVNLEHLLLSGNPIRTMPDLIADKLLSLDLSLCTITVLRRTVFSHMPLLTYVNLSGNHRLSLSYQPDEYVESKSLRRIDLSHCNMDAIELKGFPNITTVILRNNLIGPLTFSSFENNTLIENLDLSHNAINYMSVVAFRTLKRLKNIDLSFNMLRHVEPEIFRDNSFLRTINLSHNYIERFRRIYSDSLTYLNMTWCEILSIDKDAFGGMPELVELDLSNNLLSELPDHLEAKQLQILDLSRCRLSTIRNETFSGFPELSRLNLAGNRFTTIFQTKFFASNLFLNDIWLGDNPWRCECSSKEFLIFFRYLSNHPARVMDRTQLRCNSPENVYGKLWEVACNSEWYPKTRKMSTVEKVWTITMVFLINLTIVSCAVTCFKKWMHRREVAQAEEERLRHLEMTRELMRNNRLILEQESQLNAPDPRETHPPCYEDAILLPRLDTSFASLKRAGLIGDYDDKWDETIKRAVKRSRCRSEEVLCIHEYDLQNPNTNRSRRHIRAARIRRTRLGNNLPLEIPPLNTNRTVDNNNRQNDIEQFDETNERSPYAKRKIKNGFELVVPVASTSAVLVNRNHSLGMNGEIVIIENHYTSKNSLNSVAAAGAAAADVDETLSDKLKIISSSSSLASSFAAPSTSSLSIADYSTFSNDEIRNVKRTDI